MEIVREIFVCMCHWPIKMQWNVFCLCCFKFVLEKADVMHYLSRVVVCINWFSKFKKKGIHHHWNDFKFFAKYIVTLWLFLSKIRWIGEQLHCFTYMINFKWTRYCGISTFNSPKQSFSSKPFPKKIWVLILSIEII